MLVQRVGKVSIYLISNSYRIKFIHKGKNMSFTVSGGSEDKILNLAIKIASDVNLDLATDNLDITFAKYDTRYKNKVESSRNFKNLWNYYKKCKTDNVSITTQNKYWNTLDKLIETVLSDYLDFNNIDNMVAKLNSIYKETTVNNLLSHCIKPCLNLAYKEGLIDKQFNLKLNKVKSNNGVVDIYSKEEINSILDYFKTHYLYYYVFIKVLAYTGRRPEDVIALKVKDVDLVLKRITFNKAYSGGVLKSTKNNKITVYPIGNLGNIIEDIKKLIYIRNLNSESILFTDCVGNYINLDDFSYRYWKPAIKNLVYIGKLHKYLPIYKLRHSRATALLQAGIDQKTIAYLLETSLKMLDKHYLSIDNNPNLPEIV